VLDNARAGDVVVCMGAGSIGAVPGRVVELGGAMPPPASGQFTREGRVL
jgi:UDP-N-acetylmuramate--alanine ligase